MLTSQDQDQSFKEMDREVEKIQSDVKDMEQKVDKTPSLTVEEGRQKFETPNTSPNSSPRRSVGGQTPPKPRDRKKVTNENGGGLESEARQSEDDLSDDNPFKGDVDSPPSPKEAGDAVSSVITKASEAGSRSSCTGKSDDSEDSFHFVNGSFSDKSDTPSTGSPSGSYDTDSQAGSSTPLIKPSERTNRFWQRFKHSIKSRNSIVFMISATFIAIYSVAYATLAYSQDKGKFIAFITNNPKLITVPGIIALSLFAIGIFCAIKQFNNTIEHQIHEKNPDKILNEVLQSQQKNKGIGSVMLLYSNGTISHFRLNTWKSHNGFINIDEKVINRTNKIESVFNDRPVFTALLTGFVVANVALPLGLYAAGGISNVTAFYQGILATNIGLSLLVASSVIALSILCLGVHYYNKTNCTNLVYPQRHIDLEKINKKFIDEVGRRREDALKENHDKEDKGASLTLKDVVVEFRNAPTLSIACR